MAAALAEANQSFTYRGKPIHPGFVMGFLGWLSDDGPITVVDDVAAAHDANEYSDPVNVNGNRVRRHLPGTSEWLQYERLGTLSDGTHVLETDSCGGGSGVFTELFFVRFDTDKRYEPGGGVQDRLLMTVVGSYAHGAVTTESCV